MRNEPKPSLPRRRLAIRLAGGVAMTVALPLAYMYFEAQWVRYRRIDLPVQGLPQPWSGITVLHLSDIHPDSFRSNLDVLAKVVDWAKRQMPDVVFLTGDIIGQSEKSEACLALLGQLEPPLGMFAVTGNHEYGLSKGLGARACLAAPSYEGTRVVLLRDDCVELPPRSGSRLVICGADYLTGGFGLIKQAEELGLTPGLTTLEAGTPAFPILLAHEPPSPDSPLAAIFPLAFAGHTHGGQLRFPGRHGLRPLHMPDAQFLTGLYPWGRGQLVVSSGLGASFLPLRLFTRPEATLWRLVYTTSCKSKVPRELYRGNFRLEQGVLMPGSKNEEFSGDLPATPSAYVETHMGEEEPAVSHLVVATYVADAARSVPGIVGLHSSPWKSLSPRARETHSGGVVVRQTDTGAVDIEIHARVAWGTAIPELAREVEDTVHQRVAALLSIELGRVTLFVDEITEPTETTPTEAATPEEI